MKRQIIILFTLLTGLFFCNFSFAGGNSPNKSEVPWETFNLNLGVFFSAIDSSIGAGVNNVGIDVDLEEVLGLDTSTTAFRIDAFWRFTDNRRHRFDFFAIGYPFRAGKTACRKRGDAFRFQARHRKRV